MTLRVKVFGPVAAAAGSCEIVVQTEAVALTCVLLRGCLERQMPRLSGLLAVCRFAINHVYAEEGQIIHADDEVALIGLVSGG